MRCLDSPCFFFFNLPSSFIQVSLVCQCGCSPVLQNFLRRKFYMDADHQIKGWITCRHPGERNTEPKNLKVQPKKKKKKKSLKHFLAATCVFKIWLLEQLEHQERKLDLFQFYLWCSLLLPGCLTAQLIGPGGAVLCRNCTVSFTIKIRSQKKEKTFSFFMGTAQRSKA